MQDRRGFIGRLLSGVAAALGLGAPLRAAPSEPSRTYDWSQGWTNDPRWAGKLCYGKDSFVFLDGRDVSERRVRACKTGPDGWVEFLKLDAKGDPFAEVFDLWDGGKKVPKPPLYQVHSPDDDRPRYEERIAVERISGHVRYECRAAD
jgi:hypothetical protein